MVQQSEGRHKIDIAFVVVSLITAVVGAIGIRNMGTIDHMAELMYQRELLGTSHVKEANINLIYISRAEKNYLLASTPQQREAYLNNLNRFKATYKDEL